MRTRRAPLLVALVTVASLASCGDEPQTVDQADSTWDEDRIDLDMSPGDVGTMMTIGHDGEVVVVAMGPGTFAAQRVPGGELFFDDVDGHFLQPGEVVAFGDGFVAVGEDYETYRPSIWRSDDGETWSQVAPAGEVDVASGMVDLAVSGSTLIAVGSARTGSDPSRGPFAPRAWTSTDGMTWTALEVPVDVLGAKGSIRRVTATDDQVVLLGERGIVTAPADDLGEWVPVDLEGGFAELNVLDVVARGDELMIVATRETSSGPSLQIWRSASGSFELIDPPELEPREFPIVAAGGNSLVLADRESGGDDIRLCYVDLARCNAETTILVIYDASGWRRVDLSATRGGHWDVSELLVVADDLVMLASAGDGVSVARRALDSFEDTPAPDDPDLSGPPFAEPGDDLELGSTYRYPLYTHCGIEYLAMFNGRNWWSEAPVPLDQDDFERIPTYGQTILGEVTLVDDDTIEYTAGDELVATYEPRDEQPPGCA